MSFGVNGHVPVGTGQQFPFGFQPPIMGYQYTPPPPLATTPVVVTYVVEQPPEQVVLILNTPPPVGLNAVTVYRDGDPSRQIPYSARAAMRERARYVHPVTPAVVQAQHFADMRQIPGSSRGVVYRGHHH